MSEESVEVKPADFLIGIMEIFAILLPGGLLAYFFLNPKLGIRSRIFGPVLPEIEGEAQHWVAFIVTAYILGHLLSAMGDLLLDWFYDRFYANYQRVNVGCTRRWKREVLRFFKAIKKKTNDLDALARLARERKNEQLTKDAEKKEVGLYEWAANVVRLKNPTAASDIDRLQADSKFFRSLALVLIFVSIFLWRQDPGWSAFTVCLAILLFSVYRFCKLRWKATKLVYTYFLALSSKLFEKEKTP